MNRLLRLEREQASKPWLVSVQTLQEYANLFFCDPEIQKSHKYRNHYGVSFTNLKIIWNCAKELINSCGIFAFIKHFFTCKTWGACVSFLCFCAFFLDQTKHALITIWYQLVIFLSCPVSLFTIVDPWKETTWSWNCQLTFAIVKRITRSKGKLKKNNESFMKDSKSTQWDFDC